MPSRKALLVVVMGVAACAPTAPLEAEAPRALTADSGARERVLAHAFRDTQPAPHEVPAEPATDGRAALPEARAPRRGAGRPVTIDVVRAPLSEVIRLLADVGAVGVVVDESVAASPVTVKLRAVPWDLALEAVVASKGLALQRTGQVYVVAPPNLRK